MNGPDASVGGVVHWRMFSIVKLCAAMSTTKRLISALTVTALICSVIKQQANHGAPLSPAINLLFELVRACGGGREEIMRANYQDASSF